MGIKNSKQNKVYLNSDQNINKKNIRKFILGIINPQNDFFKFGTLAVPNSNDIIGPINKLRFNLSDRVNTFISLDSHPINHISFALTHEKQPYTKIDIISTMKNNDIINTKQILWPTHCVIDTHGEKIHKHLIIKSADFKIKKGTLANIESYSAFGDVNDNKYENTGLNDLLKSMSCTDIILVGLTTDYCIYYTALDALKYGYKVHIIFSCVRGVKLRSTLNIILDMETKGVNFYDDVDNFLNYFFNHSE